ncbi:hematopoietic SH2 domain-containing protein homolog isoform X2 [Clupea harengus]|uniref:Hematopoietic SH2 domain-containing protein homolog isoform X2 n=1 Tax=Clupea harengus TaxID=7950 RepID=A0A8M1K9P7_CLUHA|nr:hematopoietic SH2 domain-containing protein homolog isoform X2 [Clupea harengus]
MDIIRSLWTMDGAWSPERHEAAVAWFSGHQLGYILQNGVIPDWFHGIITRKAAEDLLSPKPAGYFLIRVSESRIGYTLSYRAQDRCRHFMIDVLPDNHYMVVGEEIWHMSLQDLVAYHRRVPILPFNELITVACGQASKDKVDYAELIFSRRDHPTHGHSTAPTSPPQWDSNVSPAADEDIPPALPYRSTTTNNEDLNQNTNASPAPAVCCPPRLYPCLQAELGAVSVQNVVQTAKPVPLPRTKHCVSTTQVDHPPELPARDSLEHRKVQPCRSINGLEDIRAASNGGPLTHPGTQNVDPHQMKNQDAKSVINFTQLKKKFQKMRGASEEHTYAEISSDVDGQNLLSPELGNKDGNRVASENEYQELPGESFNVKPTSKTSLSSGSVSESEQSLPSEYQPPPAFAPGY